MGIEIQRAAQRAKDGVRVFHAGNPAHDIERVMEPQFVLVDGRHRGADEASAAINVDQRRLGTHEFLEPGWGLGRCDKLLLFLPD